MRGRSSIRDLVPLAVPAHRPLLVLVLLLVLAPLAVFSAQAGQGGGDPLPAPSREPGLAPSSEPGLARSGEPALAPSESPAASPSLLAQSEEGYGSSPAAEAGTRPIEEERRISRSRFRYLMLGYGLIWVCLAVYLFSLNGKVGKVGREIEELKARLEEAQRRSRP